MNINPVAFSLGPVTVRWYGLLIATAMLIAAVGGCKMMRKAGINEDDFLTIFMVTIVAAILGARIYYVIFLSCLIISSIQMRSLPSGMADWRSMAGCLPAWHPFI